MRWRVVATALGAVLASIALVAAVGATLPRDHIAVVTIDLQAAPEEVWGVLAAPLAYPTWRPDVDSVRVLHDGTWPGWVEWSGRDSLSLRVVEQEAPHRMVTRIVGEDLPFGGTWTYELLPAPEGTRLRITEAGQVHNPVFRFVARFVLGHDGTLRRWADALTATLERDRLG